MSERANRDETGSIGESKSHGNVSSHMLKAMRLERNETQSRFWGRFGVTQTRGSRFELGQEIPPPVGILIRLYLDGIVSEGDLWRARRRQRIAGKQRDNSITSNTNAK
jgi:hypothetical protein